MRPGPPLPSCVHTSPPLEAPRQEKWTQRRTQQGHRSTGVLSGPTIPPWQASLWLRSTPRQPHLGSKGLGRLKCYSALCSLVEARSALHPAHQLLPVTCLLVSIFPVCPGPCSEATRGPLLPETLHPPFCEASRGPRPHCPERTVSGPVHYTGPPQPFCQV